MELEEELFNMIDTYANELPRKEKIHDVCECGIKISDMCMNCGMYRETLILQSAFYGTKGKKKPVYKPGANMRRFLFSLYNINQHVYDYDELYEEFLKFKIYFHSTKLKRGMAIYGFKGDYSNPNDIMEFLGLRNKKEMVRKYYIENTRDRPIKQMFKMFYNRMIKKDDKYNYLPSLYNTIVKRQGIEIRHILTIERVNQIGKQYQYFRRYMPKWRSVVKYLEHFHKDIYTNYLPLFEVIKGSKINYSLGCMGSAHSIY